MSVVEEFDSSIEHHLLLDDVIDDNNRKTVARLHFNSPTARYLGTFNGKDEKRETVGEPIDIYKHEAAILKRIEELASQKGA